MTFRKIKKAKNVTKKKSSAKKKKNKKFLE